MGGFEYSDAVYLTLNDPYDKYCLPGYRNLESKIIITPSPHIQYILPATNTWAVRLGSFRNILKYRGSSVLEA